jgi:hypothetical protein
MSGRSGDAGVNLVGLVYLGCILLVLFLPVLLGRGGSPPGPPDSDSDDGWGNGPWRPPDRPEPPRGGIPLDDAEPARVRLRDHSRLMDLLPARERRAAREPGRTPVRTSTRLRRR